MRTRVSLVPADRAAQGVRIYCPSHGHRFSCTRGRRFSGSFRRTVCFGTAGLSFNRFVLGFVCLLDRGQPAFRWQLGWANAAARLGARRRRLYGIVLLGAAHPRHFLDGGPVRRGPQPLAGSTSGFFGNWDSHRLGPYADRRWFAFRLDGPAPPSRRSRGSSPA